MKKFLLFLAVIFSMAVFAQQDTNLVTLEVRVTNFKDVPCKGEKIILESKKTKKNYWGVTDVAGKFITEIPKGDVYQIKYLTIGDNENYREINIPNKEGMTKSILTIKIEPPKTYQLNNIFFDVDKATLKKESFKALNVLVEVMTLKPNMVIEISGHTDNTGDSLRNMKLSQERADAVKEYLVKKDIKRDRIKTKGYGDTMPVADNRTTEGKQKNRRTEVKIIKE